MKKFIAAVFFLGAFYQTKAQNTDLRVITTGVPFLTIAPDARSAALGDQGVATSSDAFSNHWNPAKYAFASNDTGVAISYTPYLSKLVNDIFLADCPSSSYFNLGPILEMLNPARQIPEKLE